MSNKFGVIKTDRVRGAKARWPYDRSKYYYVIAFRGSMQSEWIIEEEDVDDVVTILKELKEMEIDGN